MLTDTWIVNQMHHEIPLLGKTSERRSTFKIFIGALSNPDLIKKKRYQEITKILEHAIDVD